MIGHEPACTNRRSGLASRPTLGFAILGILALTCVLTASSLGPYWYRLYQNGLLREPLLGTWFHTSSMSTALHQPGNVWCFHRDGTYEVGEGALSEYRVFGDTMVLTDLRGIQREYLWVLDDAENAENATELRLTTLDGYSAYRFLREAEMGTRLSAPAVAGSMR